MMNFILFHYHESEVRMGVHYLNKFPPIRVYDIKTGGSALLLSDGKDAVYLDESAADVAEKIDKVMLPVK